MIDVETISRAQNASRSQTIGTAAPRRRRRFGAVDTVTAVILVALMLLACLPFVLMFITSIQQTRRMTLSIDFASVTLSNYVNLFTQNGFLAALITSGIVVVIACTLNALVGAMAAYAFEKRRFPGSEALFWVYIATMMVPGQVTLIPLYTIMREIGMLNTHLALALPVVNAFGVFLLRQFMTGVPDEMLAAARIDGANEVQIFGRIVLPMMMPALITLTVFTFLTAWNDFLWPLVSITDSSMQTVTLAAANLQGRFATEYGLVMAGAAVAFSVPLIMYTILQRNFVEGAASSGLKG